MLPRRGRGTIVHSLYASQLGAVGPVLPHLSQAPLRRCLKQRFVEEASSWNVHKSLSHFSRRVSALEWHPVYHNVVAFASHGGGIHLWHYEDSSRDRTIRGLGYGYGCITAMKFHPENPSSIYTTSVDGRFCLQDFEGRQSSVFLDTQSLAYWWCSTDLCRDYNAIFVGGNTGEGVLLDSAGAVVCRYAKLHRGKIKHAEFCPARNWLLATSSVDHTVALWDMRMLRSESGTITKRPKPISVLNHNAPVNSATFDPHFGSRILTTAQNSELRVFDAANNWEEPTSVITHPHRHFQHMTDIVATWHPVHDGLCVVGRYPGREDADQSRCVDLVDVARGEIVGSLFSPSVKGVIVLNKFNRFGTRLVSGMGYHCLLWQPEHEVLQQARERVRAVREESGPLSNDELSGRDRQQKRSRKRRQDGGDKEEDKAKKKLKQIKTDEPKVAKAKRTNILKSKKRI